jgi:hypothetical protein
MRCVEGAVEFALREDAVVLEGVDMLLLCDGFED